MERPARGKLTEFVTDHVFRHVNRDEFFSVMNSERQADELWKNRGPARPGLDHFAVIRCLGSGDFVDQVIVAERTFFN